MELPEEGTSDPNRDMLREEIGQALEKFAPILLSQVEQMMDAKLEEFVQKYPVLKTSEGGPESQLSGQEMNKEERFDFKNFANCKPPEFHGEMNPMVSMRWIDEIEETFMLCECPERLKVLFAAHQMKGRGHEWWELQVKIYGFQIASKFPWKTFREMFLEKFAPVAEVDRLKGEFLTIDQGEMTVADYTGLFNDKSRFYPEFTDNPKLLCDHYLRHLKPEIREFIDPLLYDSIPKMMNKALSRELELQRRVAELAIKRKVEQVLPTQRPPFKKQKFVEGSLQQQRYQQPQSQFRGSVREIPACTNCGKRHPGECKLGSSSCYRCGKSGHLAANCRSPYKLCYYCFKDDHLQANCPKFKEDVRKVEQRQ